MPFYGNVSLTLSFCNDDDDNQTVDPVSIQAEIEPKNQRLKLKGRLQVYKL